MGRYLRDERRERSCGRVRGYVARSSLGANCAGLTKIETTVNSFSASERFTEGVSIRLRSDKESTRTKGQVSVVKRPHGRYESHRFLVLKSSSPP